MKNIEPVSIIIPTYNNPDCLSQCISSILAVRLRYPVEIIVVNNGHQDSLDRIQNNPLIKVVQTGGKNLGWEGGLKEGLKHTNREFVCFMNDDVYIPSASDMWLQTMVSTFGNPEVGAVGPSTNVVMGAQNIWKGIPYQQVEVTYLIGFCMLLRRKALDEVGGIDDTLPGGDDLDLSIRLRGANWHLVARRDVFVFHHGFVTGTRLHGNETKRGGWNSKEMTERTDIALIKKHGFRKWFECRAGLEYPARTKGVDYEGDYIRQHIIGDKILDLGCANNKTTPKAIGVDIVKRGESILNLNAKSEADVQSDVEKKMPFELKSQDTIVARHILEHCIDPIETLNHWKSYLKDNGRLIVAVPDEDASPSINMNPEHLHAFNEGAMTSLGNACGLKILSIHRTPQCSLVMVYSI